MYWKTLASCLILIGTQGIGICLCCEARNKLYHLQTQKKILCDLEEEIFFLYRPATEIMEKIAKKEKEPYNLLLSVILEYVSQGMLLSEAWQEGIKIISLQDENFKKVSGVINEFALLFSNIENHEQNNQMKWLLEKIDDEINVQKEKIRKEGKMYYLLCTFVGIFFIILFL